MRFYRKLGLISAVFVLLACTAKTDSKQLVSNSLKNANISVLVIGAGMSGIKAANQLKQHGFDVTVLEGRDRLGGRVWSDNSLGKTVDLGASWIHGIENNPIHLLAKDLGIPMYEWDYENQVTYDIHGNITTKIDDAFEENQDNFYYWSAKAFFNDSQASVQDAIDLGIKSGALKNFSQTEVDFFANVMIEQDAAADSRDISLAGLWKEGVFDGPDVIFTQGYDALVKALARGLDIRLNTWVSGINYTKKQVEVTTSNGMFKADHVIVTVPLGVLKKDKITFEPRLPEQKQAAINGLSMGVLNKVYLAFDTVFWDNSITNIAKISQQKGHWNYWINLEPATGLPILTAFNVADYGKELEKFSDEKIINLAMSELKTIYGKGIPDPKGSIITRWNQDPFSYGSYSYVPKGVSASLREELAEPVYDKVFFAGEATHAKYSATVHGAYLSGEREANRIISMHLE